MQPNPISTEMSIKTHFDDLQREAAQYRAASRAAQPRERMRNTRSAARRPLGWLRLLVARLTNA